jgi:2-oxo-4-hydroxy-4-carboxy--5-ureidoimidazoline (OHCU) decarboxylase
VKSPGIVATAFLLRRLTREIGRVTDALQRIADNQEKQLKMEAFLRNFPLQALDDIEPLTAEERAAAGAGEPDVSTQTDSDLAELERMDELYKTTFGAPPSDEEDLIEMRRKLEHTIGTRAEQEKEE